MTRPAGHRSGREVTRRKVLTTSLAATLGAGAAALTGTMVSTTPAAAATPVSGGQATVMNYGYPEVWDPHLAGTLGALGSISPMGAIILVHDKIRTAAGAFVPAQTIQTVLKWDHVWLEK